jgi:hypothetical protein
MKNITIEVPQNGTSVQLVLRAGASSGQAIIVASDEVEIRFAEPAPSAAATPKAPPSANSGKASKHDPTNGTWSATGSLTNARTYHTSTLLPNAKVLVAGGDGTTGQLSAAECYDPASETWTLTAPMGAARINHRALLLTNGKALVIGGNGGMNYERTGELYDPTSRTWTDTGLMKTSRYDFTATLLPNGRVLVAGGNSGTNSSPARNCTTSSPEHGR